MSLQLELINMYVYYLSMLLLTDDQQFTFGKSAYKAVSEFITSKYSIIDK